MKIVGARPTGNYLLVEPVEPEETTEGGLYVPKQAQEEPQVGRVVEAGPTVGVDMVEQTLDVLPDSSVDDILRDAEGNRRILDLVDSLEAEVPKEGDHVLYGKYAGSEVELEDRELLVVREEDVLLVLEVEE